jgi:hypothetical protein
MVARGPPKAKVVGSSPISVVNDFFLPVEHLWMEGCSFCGGAAWQMVAMTSGVDDHTENHDWRSSPNLLFC